MKWEVLPAKKNPKKFTFFLIFVIFISLLFGISFGPFFGILALLVLLGSNANFFTKTKYEITDRNILVRRPFYEIKKDWEWVKRIELDKNGIFLSPFEKKTWLDPFRGVFLMCDNPGEVYNELKRMGKIKEKLPESS